MLSCRRRYPHRQSCASSPTLVHWGNPVRKIRIQDPPHVDTCRNGSGLADEVTAYHVRLPARGFFTVQCDCPLRLAPLDHRPLLGLFTAHANAPLDFPFEKYCLSESNQSSRAQYFEVCSRAESQARDINLRAWCTKFGENFIE